MLSKALRLSQTAACPPGLRLSRPVTEPSRAWLFTTQVDSALLVSAQVFTKHTHKRCIFFVQEGALFLNEDLGAVSPDS